MPKPPKIVPPAKMPTTASFLSGQGGVANGMGQRPNKLIPIIGTQRSAVGKPSLLGGF